MGAGSRRLRRAPRSLLGRTATRETAPDAGNPPTAAPGSRAGQLAPEQPLGTPSLGPTEPSLA